MGSLFSLLPPYFIPFDFINPPWLAENSGPQFAPAAVFKVNRSNLAGFCSDVLQLVLLLPPVRGSVSVCDSVQTETCCSDEEQVKH